MVHMWTVTNDTSMRRQKTNNVRPTIINTISTEANTASISTMLTWRRDKCWICYNILEYVLVAALVSAKCKSADNYVVKHNLFARVNDF